MDDMVLWHQDKQELQTALEAIDRYTGEVLHLELKKPVVGKTAQGLPFLGFLIKSGGIYLLRVCSPLNSAMCKTLRAKQRYGTEPFPADTPARFSANHA
jgi:hypothetical protein